MDRTIEQIEVEQTELREKLKTVKGTETEVYSRIVGYYRNIHDWNKGKQSEFKERVNYNFPKVIK